SRMILAVARTHLARLRRDRAAFVLSFVVPVVFFSVFAAIFGGPSRSSTRQIPVAVVDEDRSADSRRFLEALRAEAGLSVRTAEGPAGQEAGATLDRAGAERIVRAGDVPVALILPKGFGEAPIGFSPSSDRSRLLILADTADPVAPQVLTGLLQKVAMTSMPDVMAQAGIAQMDRWAGPLTAEQRANLEENVRRMRERTGSGAGQRSSSSGGLVAVEVRDVLGETKKNPASALLAAGLGVMFLLFSASGAGGALIEEAESGTLDRILATNVTMTELLLGKLLYLSSVAVTQLVVMFVWGELFFGVELHRHVPGFLIMTAVTAVAASSFGLVLAALSRSRIQLVAISNLSILVMSALGGSMVPRYFLSEKIQKLGLVTLNAWAIDGFMKVFWREEPLSHLGPQVAVLLAASLVLFAGARRLARRWEAN
ncbi:MAG TPA: ABC transporter permease, partial [Thermoanaerobaculia bacterium]|nr:ABC transporter permease [Thermoanaerobaculia bacterium]